MCLAHQLRDCAHAIAAGDAVFAPRMKALLPRAVVLARRRLRLAESTRREYRRRLECALDAVMALTPTHRNGQRLRRRYARVRDHLFTFLDHPEVAADNNGSERELRPTATYRKVTGGFRSEWGADLYAAVRSVIGTAARRGVDAYQAIQQTLRGHAITHPGRRIAFGVPAEQVSSAVQLGNPGHLVSRAVLAPNIRHARGSTMTDRYSMSIQLALHRCDLTLTGSRAQLDWVPDDRNGCGLGRQGPHGTVEWEALRAGSLPSRAATTLIAVLSALLWAAIVLVAARLMAGV